MMRFLSLAIPFVLSFAFSAYVHAETTLSGAVRVRDDISPAQITAQQDNYNPTGLKGASVLRLDSDASRDITGLAGGYDGRVLNIHNVGSFNIVLKDASGSSSAANQFALTGDLTLAPDACVILQYDSTSSKWRAIGHSGSGGVAHSSLTGLTSGDDHTQYALLAGRSGGQTLKGGTGSGDDLTLNSTNHATKGSIFLGASADTIERQAWWIVSRPVNGFTSDATPTAINSITLSDAYVYHLRVRVLGVRTSGAARESYEFLLTAYRTGAGVASIQDSTTVHAPGAPTWTVACAASGNDIQVNATGGAYDVNWTSQIEYVRLSE